MYFTALEVVDAADLFYDDRLSGWHFEGALSFRRTLVWVQVDPDRASYLRPAHEA